MPKQTKQPAGGWRPIQVAADPQPARLIQVAVTDADLERVANAEKSAPKSVQPTTANTPAPTNSAAKSADKKES